MNHLILEANKLIQKGNFAYAFCGGFAIELFLNKIVRKHGDIDISAFWDNRDDIILYMQSLGWQVYEMCGGGIAHYITDVKQQIKEKRNIFCFRDDCELVSFTPTNETDMYSIVVDHKGQVKLNFVEFLFNDRTLTDFSYARNKEILLPLSSAVLYQTGIPYLAPELVLLYKSTDILREGYQLDYDLALPKMSKGQKEWLKNALLKSNPLGHPWIAGC